MSHEMMVFTLYSREGCHLCEDMIRELSALQRDQAFTVHMVDIDTDPDLQARYDRKVPVLAHGDVELTYYFLDEALFLDYLKR
jgi:hypothetical protein